MNVLNRTEELFNKLLDEHPPELILGALDEMARMLKEELIAPGMKLQKSKKLKIHQPD